MKNRIIPFENISEQNQKKAIELLKSADFSMEDIEITGVVSHVLQEKQALLKACDPQIQNYEDFLGDKLWKNIQKENPALAQKQTGIQKKNLWSWVQVFSPRVALSGLAVFGLWVLVQSFWLAQPQSQIDDPFFHELAEMPQDAASADDLDSWLASIGDSHMRYVLTSQDLSGLGLRVQHLELGQRSKAELESLFHDLTKSSGADL
jgi:hypothetical protein